MQYKDLKNGRTHILRYWSKRCQHVHQHAGSVERLNHIPVYHLSQQSINSLWPFSSSWHIKPSYYCCTESLNCSTLTFTEILQRTHLSAWRCNGQHNGVEVKRSWYKFPPSYWHVMNLGNFCSQLTNSPVLAKQSRFYTSEMITARLTESNSSLLPVWVYK